MAQSLSTKKPRASKTYQSVEINDMTGGLDLRQSPTLVAPNRAVGLSNYALSEPGALVVRPGYLNWASTSLGASRPQGGDRIYLSGAQFTLLAWDGGVYKPTDAGVLSSTPVYSTVNTSNQIYFPYDRDLVAVMDGANQSVKSTNGTTGWTQFGITASTKRCTGSSAGTGTLSSSIFEFTFSYKDRGLAHESNETTNVSTVTMSATGSINLQVPNSTDPQVDAIVVYARNVSAGETVRRKATSGAASTAASSTFAITSSAWSANVEAPYDHDVPPVMEFAVVWKNRWWGKSATVGNRIHFTQLFQNQSWPALFYVDIPFERGDSIMAMVAQGDTLVIFGESKTYLIIGTTSLDFEVRPSAGAQAGALGPRAVETIENGILHAAAEGVFIFDGATDKLLSFDIEPGWRDLVAGATPATLKLVDIVYHFPRKEVRIAVPRRYPLGTYGEWVLDLNRTRESERPCWTSTDRTIGGYIGWFGAETVTGYRGRLFSWSPTEGRIFEEATGVTANSSNMVASYEGPHLATGLHVARFVDLRGEYEPHAGTFNTETVVDEISQGSKSITIGAALAVYGTAVYDTAVYAGAGRKMFYQIQPLTSQGRTAWLKTTYTGKEAFRHFTYNFGIVPEPVQRAFGD